MPVAKSLSAMLFKKDILSEKADWNLFLRSVQRENCVEVHSGSWEGPSSIVRADVERETLSVTCSVLGFWHMFLS